MSTNLEPKMEEETTKAQHLYSQIHTNQQQQDHAESESDESDTEEGSNKAGSRDSNALLDTWLAELDSLTTVSFQFISHLLCG